VGITQDRWLVYGKFGGGWAQDSAALNGVNAAEQLPHEQRLAGGSGHEYAFAN
jgi:hypothetical protein